MIKISFLEEDLTLYKNMGLFMTSAYIYDNVYLHTTYLPSR